MKYHHDTIAALATAQGMGGIAVIRISGEEAKGALEKCFRTSQILTSHRLCYGHVLDSTGAVIDETMAVFMRAPHTYTREDVCEIHCHGGSIQVRRILERLFELGVKPAQPGEFTKRAFMNGRLSLSQAEAVMALIGSSSQAQARSAMRQIQGSVSRAIDKMAVELARLISLIEAGNDFPEEIDEQATESELIASIDQIIHQLTVICDPKRARIVRDGFHVAIVGRPNTGKSSLLNALCEEQRAIVSQQAGTTRDVLRENIEIKGIPITLNDTAGQRDTDDEVEKIGVTRARQIEQSADLVLMVLEASDAISAEEIKTLKNADERYVVIVNKTDLAQVLDLSGFENLEKIHISAMTGAGIDALKNMIAKKAGDGLSNNDQMTVRRHVDAALDAITSLQMAKKTIEKGFSHDVCAIDLSLALEKLMLINGQSATETVISQIFSNFCVGK